ncbi:DsbA family protein [Niveibacterium sp. SC-1]|uniref:DsbA family protein n=1 Tax=Niveibacterium sp. SC-1 TaxID=3135646 RepID=UPI00311EAA15
MSTTLHYVHDPLCGWCYAAAPLTKAAARVPGLAIALHGGGLFTGEGRRHAGPALRDYVIPHDQRIAMASGQPFGEAYFEGLLRDEAAVFDSEPPIRAVMAADALGRGLDYFHRAQTAHYVEGRRISEATTLHALALELELGATAFAAAMEAIDAAQLQAHMQESRALMQTVGGRGFPTFALEQDGTWRRIELNAFLGQPEAFAAELAKAV